VKPQGEAPLLIVHQDKGVERWIRLTIGEHQVLPAVIVDVSCRDARKPRRRRVRNDGGGGLERAVAIAQRQQIAGCSEIQLAVIVEVGQHYPPSGIRRRRSALQCECPFAIAQIGEQGVRRAVDGHQQVRDAVPIQITRDHTHRTRYGNGSASCKWRLRLPGSQHDRDTRCRDDRHIWLAVVIEIRRHATTSASRNRRPSAVLKLAFALIQHDRDVVIGVCHNVGQSVLAQISEGDIVTATD
jgi:hypothetical protein